MKRTNRRMLIAIKGFSRGPALRDAPGDSSGDGGSGTTDDAGTGKDGTGTDDSTKPDFKGEYNKDQAERALAAARAGEAKAKADKKAADERVAAVLKAAGLKADGTEDPAELLKAEKAARATSDATARDTAVELAVYKVASKPDSGVNADAVVDSRNFQAAVKDFDPSAADFGDKVAAAIKAAIAANPSLGVAKTVTNVGADLSGSGGNDGTAKSKTLAEATARHYSQ